jgi:hypothetical protein
MGTSLTGVLMIFTMFMKKDLLPIVRGSQLCTPSCGLWTTRLHLMQLYLVDEAGIKGLPVVEASATSVIDLGYKLALFRDLLGE